MRANRNLQTLMRERTGDNRRQLKFCRCDISAEGIPADQPGVSGGGREPTARTDARKWRASWAAAKAPRLRLNRALPVAPSARRPVGRSSLRNEPPLVPSSRQAGDGH
jgi:hypothetical protein